MWCFFLILIYDEIGLVDAVAVKFAAVSKMNKLLRHQLKMQHYYRRLRNYRISKKEAENPDNNFFSFRYHGKPCSCWCCSPKESKYNRAKQKATERKIALSGILDI